MPISESDPRVFFAAERTLLAWLRTGLTIIALGFVVSRFGLFIQLFEAQLQSIPAVSHTSLSAFMGILFVITGSLPPFSTTDIYLSCLKPICPPGTPNHLPSFYRFCWGYWEWDWPSIFC